MMVRRLTLWYSDMKFGIIGPPTLVHICQPCPSWCSHSILLYVGKQKKQKSISRMNRAVTSLLLHRDRRHFTAKSFIWLKCLFTFRSDGVTQLVEYIWYKYLGSALVWLRSPLRLKALRCWISPTFVKSLPAILTVMHFAFYKMFHYPWKFGLLEISNIVGNLIFFLTSQHTHVASRLVLGKIRLVITVE